MEITHKLDYTIDNEEDKRIIEKYDSQYSSALRIIYNFIKKNNLSTSYKEHTVKGSLLMEYLKKMNNIELIIDNYWIRESVISNACDIISSEEKLKKLDQDKIKSYLDDIKKLKTRLETTKKKRTRKSIIRRIDKLHHKIQVLEVKEYKAIFGTKKVFKNRCKKLITHEDFVKNKLTPLYSKGDTEHFNRLFEISSDLKTIVFKPTEELHINFNLNCNEYREQIKSLFFAQKYRELPCTFRFDSKYVYISYDNSKLNKNKFSHREFITNRIMSIDMNPNYIGWIIVDWSGENKFKIIESGIYSIEKINDLHFSLKNKHYPSSSPERKHVNNLRTHSIFEISKGLINKALYYKCEIFAYEKLVIYSDDKNRGKKFNSLCNNLWCRDKFIKNIKKRCDAYHITHKEQLSEYSSFIGNFLFRSLNLPDMCLAAFEIGRRAYQSRYNFCLPKEERKKNIVFPDLFMFKDFLAISLEEFGLEDSFSSLKEQYDSFKKSRKMYRLLLCDFNIEFLKLFTKKSKIEHYQFINDIFLYN